MLKFACTPSYQQNWGKAFDSAFPKPQHVPMASDWKQPPKNLRLVAAEVHVWLAALEPDSTARSLLSSEEQERADRFRFEKDQVQYTAGRAFLRTILGRYLQISPKDLRFRYNGYGKPYLADEFASTKLHFNLAHSRGLALYAVAVDTEVGVDIEHIRPEFATTEIAQRFFAPEEVKVLLSLDPAIQKSAFFDCWTRKEAFIKARGMGLSLPLDQFVVAFGPNVDAALLSAKNDAQASKTWTIGNLAPAHEYAGAFAAPLANVQLRLWRFTPG